MTIDVLYPFRDRLWLSTNRIFILDHFQSQTIFIRLKAMPVLLVIVVVDRGWIDLQDSRFRRGWLDSELLEKEIPVVSCHLHEPVCSLQSKSLDQLPLAPAFVQVTALNDHHLMINGELYLQDSVDALPGLPAVL